MTSKKIKAIYGTKDILPAEYFVWQKIVATVSELTSRYRYGFINSPVFEATELFSRGIGETSDIVSKEMYTFEDQGGRSLTLRPEGTASVIRAYNEHSLGASQGLVKVWYAGPMFRQERPQAGRYRQFYQFGVEAVGSLDPALDAEVIALNWKIMESLGISDMTLYLNSIGMPDDRKAHRESFVKFVKPNIDNFCKDCQRRLETNPLRMFDCKEKECISLLVDAPVVFDFLSDENREHFDKVINYLEMAGVPFEIDKRLVRGLDYYTRTAWEIKSAKLGSQDSISGGGRYDILVEQLGGKPTPGIGFAAGMERIILAMPDELKTAPETDFGFYIAVRTNEFKSDAYKLMMKLRDIGIYAEKDYFDRSLKAQMKQANKSGLEYVIIMAEDEMERGAVVIRNLVNSEQVELKLDDIYKIESLKQFKEVLDKSE